MEMCEVFEEGILIPSMCECGLMYFSVTTSVQRLWEVMIYHPIFAVRALVRKSRFMMSQPPLFLGKVMLSHFIDANVWPSLFPVHRNLRQSCWILGSTPLGSQERDIQYTRVAKKTILIWVSMPSHESQRWFHIEIFFSGFTMSHRQSTLW